ncbi:MAG: glutathione S-transferase [Nitrosomonadales bacterium]|nr:glutathione S-transferase [Nitrosomonadales bacterium]|tara:strand:- start:552 stop:1190 length:639 start_codon:yes stop_codon:yes gene_type:complete
MNYVEQLNKSKSKPYLFSYRRCPYAMRARMALVESEIEFDVYEISLRNKPQEMLSISQKGTVPVLKLNELVIDESLEIMKWAYKNSKSNQINNIDLELDKHKIANELIELNDGKFKDSLDQYKYFERYPNKSKEEHRKSCYFFLDILEKRLKDKIFLISDERTFVDISIFPFIRQFMNVDKVWFDSSDYIKVRKWLMLLVESDLFKKIMVKP